MISVPTLVVVVGVLVVIIMALAAALVQLSLALQAVQQHRDRLLLRVGELQQVAYDLHTQVLEQLANHHQTVRDYQQTIKQLSMGVDEVAQHAQHILDALRSKEQS